MDVRIVYSPSDALKLARAQSRQARDVLRHRLRDHGALHRADADARQGRGHPQLLGLLQSRHHHSRDPRDSRFARHAARRLHRPGPRLHRDRLPSLRVDRQRRRQADRGLRLRAARHAAVDRDAAAPAEGGRSQGREPVQARGALGRQPRRAARPWPRSSSCVLISNGAAWASSRSRRCASATSTPSGTRSSASTCPACA